MKLYVLLITGTRERPSEAQRTIIKERIDRHMLAANTVAPEYPRGRCFVVLEGGADGVDAFAQYHGELRGSVPGTFKANWNHYRKAAGPVRNGVLLETALSYHRSGHEVHVEAFPGPLVDPSKPGGTRDMIGKVLKSELAERLIVTELQ